MKNNLTGSLCTVNSGMLNNHNGMISKYINHIKITFIVDITRKPSYLSCFFLFTNLISIKKTSKIV